MAFTQTIGKNFPHGFAGCYAYQPDMIVKTRPAGGDAPFAYGTPLKYATGTNGNVVPMGAGDAATEDGLHLLDDVDAGVVGDGTALPYHAFLKLGAAKTDFEFVGQIGRAHV